MSQASATSSPKAQIDFSQVIEKKRDTEASTLEERVAELLIVCQDAAALEQCRRKAGQLPVEQAPWPSSTIEFMRKAARKFHE